MSSTSLFFSPPPASSFSSIFSLFPHFPRPYGPQPGRCVRFRRLVFRVLYLLSSAAPSNLLTVARTLAEQSGGQGNKQGNREQKRKWKYARMGNEKANGRNESIFGELFLESECERFYTILGKKGEKRTEEELGLVMSVLEKPAFFAEMPMEIMKLVARELVLEVYLKDQIVFFQGDIGDMFYIVASGSVDVKIKRNMGYSYTAGSIHEGDTFGDLAVSGTGISDNPQSASAKGLRAATIIASSEQTKLLGIAKETYKHVKAHVVLRSQQRAEFLRNINLPIFRALQADLVAKLGSIVYSKKFKSQQAILLQGTTTNFIHFIKHGDCSIIKTVQVPYVLWLAHQAKSKNEMDEMLQSKENKNQLYPLSVMIGNLKPGDCFGCLPVEHGKFQTSPFSIITNSQTVVYSVASDEIMDRLVDKSIKEYSGGIKSGGKMVASLDKLAQDHSLIFKLKLYLESQDVSEHDVILGVSQKVSWDAYKVNTVWNLKKESFSSKVEQIPQSISLVPAVCTSLHFFALLRVCIHLRQLFRAMFLTLQKLNKSLSLILSWEKYLPSSKVLL